MCKFWIFVLGLALSLSACQSRAVIAPEIEITGAWVRAVGGMGGGMPGTAPTSEPNSGMENAGMNSAAYLVLTNKGGTEDRLLSVRCDFVKAAELHRSMMNDGVMSMSPVENIAVPAGEQVELKPGGLHIMLIGLSRELNAGDVVSLTLVFEISGEKIIQAEVRAP